MVISLNQQSKIKTYVGLVTAVLAITIILLPVDVEGLQVLPTSFDKSKYGVGDTPVVTIVSPSANLNPNEIDSINVSVKLLVFLSHAGVKIATVTIQETGPNTGIFQGELLTISLQHMKHELTGKDNKFIQAVCSSGCGGSAFTQAELTQSSQSTSSGDIAYEKNGFSLKIPSSWSVNDQTSRDGSFVQYASITNPPGTSEAYLQIGKYEDQTPSGSNQEYLDKMYASQKALCDSSTFDTVGFTCSNVSLGFSDYTIDEVTAYAIAYSFLQTFPNGSTTTYVTALARVTDGTDTWELLGITLANNPNPELQEIFGTFKISGVMNKDLNSLGESDDTSTQPTPSEPEYQGGSISCPSISGWKMYNQFQGTSRAYTCEYESTPDPIYGTNYASLWLEWYDPVPQYVDPGSGSWCSGDTSGGTHYSSTRYVLVGFDQYYSEFYNAGKTLLKHAESIKIGALCSSSGNDSSKDNSIYVPEPEPTPEIKPTPKSFTDDDTQDSRCPDKYPIYLEKYDLCQADVATDPRCTVDFPIFLEEHGVCAAVVRVSAINTTPLSALNDYSEIMEEGKRLVEDDKNYDKAILYFKKAIQLEPDNVVGFYNLAETLYNYGDKKASVEYYYKMLELSPNHLAAKRALQAMNLPIEPTKSSDETPEQTEYDGWIKQGSYDLANRNYDEAIKNFDLAYKQNPNDQNLILLKSEALKKKGMALADDGKFDLAVVFLGESNHLKPDEFVKAIQNNAYNSWTEEIKQETVIFDPNVIDKFQLIEPISLPPLPTVGKGSHDEVTIIRHTQGSTLSEQFVTDTSTLNVGDVIYVNPHVPPFTIDWGHATTTIQPGSVFLIGKPEHLQTFAKGDPHYIEVVEGQLRTYEALKEYAGEDVCFLVKTRKNLNQVCSDVTFTLDKTTDVFTIQVDDGTVKGYNVITDSIMEYGAGTTLVTNSDGYYLVESAAAQPEHETMVTEMQEKSENLNGGGCLIATATFGSELAPQVQQLRELRDNTLLQTESGSAFMTGFNEFYYSFSPGIADLERQNPVFKGMVKLAITPLLASLSLLNFVDIDSEETVLTYGIGIILMNVGMYFVAPTIIIHRIKKFV